VSVEETSKLNSAGTINGDERKWTFDEASWCP